MPLLSTAKRILIVTVAEDQGHSDEEGARLLMHWPIYVPLIRLPYRCGLMGRGLAVHRPCDLLRLPSQRLLLGRHFF